MTKSKNVVYALVQSVSCSGGHGEGSTKYKVPAKTSEYYTGDDLEFFTDLTEITKYKEEVDKFNYYTIQPYVLNTNTRVSPVGLVGTIEELEHELTEFYNEGVILNRNSKNIYWATLNSTRNEAEYIITVIKNDDKFTIITVEDW